MLPFLKEEVKSNQDAKLCYICGKRFLKKLPRSINYRKVKDHCHYTGKYKGAAYSICNLTFNVPNDVPVVFHNISNYDFDFSIKELAYEFEGKFTEKYKTFSDPIDTEFKEIDKDSNESVVTITNLLIVQDLWPLHYQILLII